jgi:hypothetical protein
MAISDTQKTDFVWKKLIYGATNTSTNGKAGYEEAVGSPLTVFAGNIIAETIPTPAPNATVGVLEYYDTSTALRLTVDNTVAGNRTWIACSTFGDLATRIGDWIPPSVDATYLVGIYKDNATIGGNKLNQGTNNNEFVFDYQSGVLTFINTVPSLTSVWLVGHRYVGGKGLGGAGVNVKDDQVIISGLGSPVTNGQHTLTNFFAHIPQNDTVTVSFNGMRLNDDQYSVGGLNLVLEMDNIPYDLENDDVISARYAWKG